MTPSYRHQDLDYFVEVFSRYHPALMELDPLEPNPYPTQDPPTRRLALANRILRAVMQQPRRIVNNIERSFVGEMSLVYCGAKDVLNLDALVRVYLSHELFAQFLSAAQQQFDPAPLALSSAVKVFGDTGLNQRVAQANHSMQRSLGPALHPYAASLNELPNLLWKFYGKPGFIMLFRQSVAETRTLFQARFNAVVDPEEVVAVWREGAWVYQPNREAHSLIWEDEAPPESFANKALAVLRQRKLRLLL